MFPFCAFVNMKADEKYSVSIALKIWAFHPGFVEVSNIKSTLDDYTVTAEAEEWCLWENPNYEHNMINGMFEAPSNFEDHFFIATHEIHGIGKPNASLEG